ncbi:MAG: class I SAM-dependent methyltransferase [Sulfuritalea sp.]|nr:class I SAM-dependent methyltransferase [Sulfuritalea sp.]
MNRTNWDQYYQKPYRAAQFTRSITSRNLLEYMRNGLRRSTVKFPTITEIGGANSCFFEAIYDSLAPELYQIIDNNESGLDRFRQRISADRLSKTTLINCDVLTIGDAFNLGGKDGYQLSDIVFSVGLVEHFSPEETFLAIQSHFHLARPGGLVIVSAPTPTFLYRVARYLAEKAGVWIFHDERPLEIPELLRGMKELGEVAEYKIIWPIVFTQAMIAARKRSQ